MLITHLFQIGAYGLQESGGDVVSQSPGKFTVGFGPETFWFWTQLLNPLHYSPQILRHNVKYSRIYLQSIAMDVLLFQE